MPGLVSGPEAGLETRSEGGEDSAEGLETLHKPGIVTSRFAPARLLPASTPPGICTAKAVLLSGVCLTL